MKFRILFQDEWLVAIDKPAGFQVHPPEDPRHTLARGRNCLFLLRRQIEKKLYPVHRLDSPTSGVLIFALDPMTAAGMQRLFQQEEIQKTYVAVARGWLDERGSIDYPLKSIDEPVETEKPALTHYQLIARAERPSPIGRYDSARHSLLFIEPRTGRRHQIRRHLAHLSHPLIGDSIYGDGRHNRYFKELLGEKQLFLKAYALDFRHPATGERIHLHSRWSGTWHRVFDYFGVCPYFPVENTKSGFSSSARP